MQCLKCGLKNAKKNGFVKGKQRYQCRSCGYQFTRETPRGVSMDDRRFAVILYATGLSRRLIARVIGVSVTTICRWVDMYYSDLAKRNRPVPLLTKIKPEDIIQNIVIKGAPPRKLHGETYVLSVEAPTGYLIDLVLQAPPKNLPENELYGFHKLPEK